MVQFIPSISEKEYTQNGDLKEFKGTLFEADDLHKLIGFGPSDSDLYWSVDLGLYSGNIVYIKSSRSSGLYRYYRDGELSNTPPCEEDNSKLQSVSENTVLKYRNNKGNIPGWYDESTETFYSLTDLVNIAPVADKSLLQYIEESEKLLKHEI